MRRFSPAIPGRFITDAFPQNQRGLALGIGNIAAISGSFIGLVLGGVLAAINWRLIFLVSVPLGLSWHACGRFWDAEGTGPAARRENRLGR